MLKRWELVWIEKFDAYYLCCITSADNGCCPIDGIDL
jgi:hypothetical protein